MPAPPTGRALLLGGGSGPPQQQSAAAGGGVPTPPSSRALLLGGGSAMALDVQGGYRAVCGRSKDRRAVAANVAKKKTFQSVIVDNTVEVARAAGKVKAMAARDGLGYCPNFNQTALPCKTSARCR